MFSLLCQGRKLALELLVSHTFVALELQHYLENEIQPEPV